MDRRPRSEDRTLLILDLDETLIFATEAPLDRPADFVVYGYHVYRRPWLAEFLSAVAQDFDLAVWSSASDPYVHAVVAKLFEAPGMLQFVWGRSRATLSRRAPGDNDYMLDPWDHMHYLKSLRKVKRLGWRLERVLIVDDTPEKCIKNYGNAIHPRPFYGDVADCELKALATYLTSLRNEPNVRTIEKRRWRDQIDRL